MENVGGRKLWRIQLFRLFGGENFGEFSYLDYLGEKTLVNSLFQINTEIKGSVKLREKTIQ